MLDNEIWRYLPFDGIPTLISLAMGVPAMLYVALVHTRRSRTIAKVMLVVWVLPVLAITARGRLRYENAEFEWHVGRSIMAEWHNINQSLGVMNIVGNVIMFMPLGWLVVVLWPNRAVARAVVVSALVSLAIETWQTLGGSPGDIDDVVLNSLGGLLGALMVLGIQRVARRRRQMPLRYRDAIEQAPRLPVEAFTMQVDGHTFAVSVFRDHATGSLHSDYDWLTGPNKGYGFAVGGGKRPTQADHSRSIRGFLAMIDPATGFIAEGEPI